MKIIVIIIVHKNMTINKKIHKMKDRLLGVHWSFRLG